MDAASVRVTLPHAEISSMSIFDAVECYHVKFPARICCIPADFRLLRPPIRQAAAGC